MYVPAERLAEEIDALLEQLGMTPDLVVAVTRDGVPVARLVLDRDGE